MAIRILIADDHAVVRRGIMTLLEDAPDMNLIGEASDGDEAMAMIPVLQPDVLLLDITMPKMSGLDVTKLVSTQYPGVRILIFSMHNNPDYILNTVQNGASGYVPKDSDHDEILRAIRTVSRGELYYPPSASSLIIRYLMHGKAAPIVVAEPINNMSPRSIWTKLTSREAQILTCLIEGMNSRDIAQHFGSSPNTVANQRASLIRKAGVSNTAELISLALRERK